MSLPAPYHVTIVGAGVVGSAMAAALRRAPGCAHLRVALVDSSLADPQPKDNLRHLRTATITPRSRRFIDQIASLDWETQAASFRTMRVWDDDDGSAIAGRLTFEQAPADQPLGYVVENELLRAAILRSVQDLGDDKGPKVDTIAAKVQKVTAPSDSSSPDWVKLHLQDRGSSTIATQLLILADGARSFLRDSLKMPWFAHSYSQRAVVANVRTSEPNNVAWQRFLQTGPVAMLPCRGYDVSNVVWSTTLAEASLLERASPENFIAELNEAFAASDVPGPRFPSRSVEVVGPRASFPLSIGHAPEYVRPRVMLMGDAAHVVHPLAGQGVNIGLADAQCALQMIERGARTGRDLGERALLLTYQRDRLPAALKWMGILHGLQSSFGVQWTPFAAARRLGMRFVNATSPIKDRLQRIAAGEVI